MQTMRYNMEEQNYIVYMYINKINNKKYIGQTKRSLQARSGKNGIKYKRCCVFWAAIQKYKWENFQPIILKKDLTKKEADEYQKYYISLYDTTNNKYGYNICEGGEGRTAPVSEETKIKIRNSTIGEKNHFYGKHHTEESLQKIRQARKKQVGEKNPFYGKHHTEESKRKISEAKKGQGNKAIYCITTGEYFNSIKEASQKYNILPCDISKNCNKHRKSAGKHPITGEKMVWCFVEERTNK